MSILELANAVLEGNTRIRPELSSKGLAYEIVRLEKVLECLLSKERASVPIVEIAEVLGALYEQWQAPKPVN